MQDATTPRRPERPDSKPGLHTRNRHRTSYDFPALTDAYPPLAVFVTANLRGEPSIDFADAAAVKALNRALLTLYYSVADWDIPDGYLCPPVPGRADYLHHLADLLARDGGGGRPCRVLDIGTGANLIYPLLGYREYGWHFVGCDIDEGALANARRILAANPDLAPVIELRRQTLPTRVLFGIVRPGERFDLVMCNPPFHATRAEAQEATQRKWRQLGKTPLATLQGTPRLNFGGRGAELYCTGGELAFVRRLIEESARLPDCSRWFTTLVSQASNLPAIRAALRAAGAHSTLTVDMAQGHKKSRYVAWTYAAGPTPRHHPERVKRPARRSAI